VGGTKALSRKIAIALGMACIVLIVGTFQSSNKIKIASATEAISQWGSAVTNQNTMAFLDPNNSEVLDHWNQIQTSQLDRFNHLTLFWFEQFITLLNSTSITEGTADGLLLTMTLKPLYRLGETVDMVLTVTNISNETAYIWFDNFQGNHEFDFWVYDAMNNFVFSSALVPGPVPYVLPLHEDITIDPGQAWSTDWSWQQSNYVSNVLPGTYYIIGQFGSVNDYQSNVYVKTTPMQITILPF
jgi:hypothetical protein